MSSPLYTTREGCDGRGTSLRGLDRATPHQPIMESPRCPYACVASPSREILVECSLSQGSNASEIAGRVLQRLPMKPGLAGRRTYTMGVEGFTFRFAWTANAYVFVVLERGLDDPWRFVGRMRQRWEAEIGSDTLVSIAVTTTVARPFAATLSELLSRPAAALGMATNDDLTDVNDRLEAVRTVMHDSIEKVVERGERIELLVDRADKLERNATAFSKNSNALRRRFRWQNIRCYIIVAGASLTALALLAISSCGGVSLPECRVAGAVVNAAAGG